MQISDLDFKRSECYGRLLDIIRVFIFEVHPSLFPDLFKRFNADCNIAEKLGISDSDNILRIAKQLRNYVKDQINASKDQES